MMRVLHGGFFWALGMLASAIVVEAQHSTQDLAQLRSVAEGGDPQAQFDLGYRYYFANGIPQNYELAAKWFQRAAEQVGPVQPYAQNALGHLYHHGQGVTQDYAAAVAWYQRADAHPRDETVETTAGTNLLALRRSGLAWAGAPRGGVVYPELDFGEDTGRYTTDGECDDPRFVGEAAAPRATRSGIKTDATDCRILLRIGQVRWRVDTRADRARRAVSDATWLDFEGRPVMAFSRPPCPEVERNVCVEHVSSRYKAANLEGTNYRYVGVADTQYGLCTSSVQWTVDGQAAPNFTWVSAPFALNSGGGDPVANAAMFAEYFSTVFQSMAIRRGDTHGPTRAPDGTAALGRVGGRSLRGHEARYNFDQHTCYFAGSVETLMGQANRLRFRAKPIQDNPRGGIANRPWRRSQEQVRGAKQREVEAELRASFPTSALFGHDYLDEAFPPQSFCQQIGGTTLSFVGLASSSAPSLFTDYHNGCRE